MVEKAFAFWKEKDREILDQSEARHRGINPHRGGMSVTFPRQNPPSSQIPPKEVDPTEFLKPIKKNRPHTIAVVQPKQIDDVISQNITATSEQENGEEADTKTTSTSMSAPPTLESRKPSWSWKKDSKSRQQTVGAVSNKRTSGFISYLDGPIDFPQETTNEDEEQPLQYKGNIVRSSPVVTRPTRARHYSFEDEMPAAALFCDRTNLEDPFISEVQEFWDLVQRIIKDTEKERTYLTSPAISRHVPQPKGILMEQEPVSSRTSKLPSRVTLAVETGPIMEGDNAVSLNCKATSTVAESIQEVLAMIEHCKSTQFDHHVYMLKVCGKDEYFENDRCLLDYEYIHHCMKLAKPAHLVLMERSLVKHVMLRTSMLVKLESSIPFKTHTLSRKELTSLVDSYLTKDAEFRSSLTTPPVNYTRLCQTILACVKLICERLGFFEPVCLSEAVYNLKRVCNYAQDRDSLSANIAVDVETDWSNVSTTQLKEMQVESATDVKHALGLLREGINTALLLYCQMLHCDYEPVGLDKRIELVEGNLMDSGLKLRVQVCGLHRIPVQEMCSYNTFQVEVCVYYGGLAICKRVFSPPSKIVRNFFPTVTWNKWINTGLILCELPRECRISFTLYGLNPPTNPKEYKPIKEPIAWVAKQLFTTKGTLVSGPQLLGMWKDDSPADPTDTPHPNIDRKSLLLEVKFEEYNYRLNSKSRPIRKSSMFTRPNRPAPPQAIAKNIQDIASKDRFYRLKEEDQRLVWSHRNSTPTLLSSYARGLPTLIQSLPSWHPQEIEKLQIILLQWPVSDPTHGVELLDSQYADSKVRQKAAEMISGLSEDDFIHLLPQIVQSLKHDCYLSSAMSELLLKQAITSPRISYYLYWILLPLTVDPHFGWQYELLQCALLASCGEEMAMELAQQSDLVKGLSDVACIVKNTRDVQRQTCLVHELQNLSSSLPPVFRLPLNPTLQCCDIDVENCSFFNSKTVPLKLTFKNADPFGSNIEVIYKAGDDLRQDMLALQLIRLMDKIWVRAGLDLRLITYQVLATGEEQGMVEVVTESATLRQIQTEHGLTGSFKDKPLYEWLMRYNPSDTAWKNATENFTHSCAGYCVATYVLGICDRHNDNIMIRKSGQMFHIDFGRILGNAQMFGSIKRDRVPFVLTPDMAYVINAGDKPSVRFQKFNDLCCDAFNELRKHSHLFLSLLSLLLSSNLPELSSIDDIKYVRDALLPTATQEEATVHFTKYIEASLGSMATRINFFIHNLAQFKFVTPSSTEGLLSFSPTSYSIATDAKILSAIVVAYHMKYYPEKYIVYQIQVTRCDATKQNTTLFRRYSEFNELHNKLLENFPEDPLPQLLGKKYLPGQSYTKETCETRREGLSKYLSSLLEMDARISESDVIYTFLHCLLRDEQDLRKMREEEQISDTVTGKIKLDIRYLQHQKRLSIMVQHARELVPREGAESTDPYVKLYLLPDPQKTTKQKTKIARKTLNPTYNEMLYYNLTPVELRTKCLQLTVWDASSILSKECLGCVLIELQPLYNKLIKGFVSWFDLQPAALINR